MSTVIIDDFRNTISLQLLPCSERSGSSPQLHQYLLRCIIDAPRSTTEETSAVLHHSRRMRGDKLGIHRHNLTDK